MLRKVSRDLIPNQRSKSRNHRKLHRPQHLYHVLHLPIPTHRRGKNYLVSAFQLAFCGVCRLVVGRLLAALGSPGDHIVLIVPILIRKFLFNCATACGLSAIPCTLISRSRDQRSTSFVTRLSKANVFRHIRALSSARRVTRTVSDKRTVVIVAVPSSFTHHLGDNRRTPVRTVASKHGPVATNLTTDCATSVISTVGIRHDNRRPLVRVHSHV